MGLRTDWQERLRALQDKKDALWLAELGAWLHNIGKLRRSDNINYRHPTGLVWQAVVGHEEEWDALLTRLGWDKPPTSRKLRDANDYFADHLPQDWLRTKKVELPAPFTGCVLAELIEFQQAYWYSGGEEALTWLGRKKEEMPLPHLLQRCHERASNAEKEGDAQETVYTPGGGKPILATVFGHDAVAEDVAELWAEIGNDPMLYADRNAFLVMARKVLRRAPADGRIPINDYTLYDIGLAAAAFLKAAIAQGVLEGELDVGTGKGSDEETLRFRPLRIGIDEAQIYSSAWRIPDVLGRQDVVRRLLDQVKEHLEAGLCVGNEVYRDAWGSVFLLPDLKDDPEGTELQAWMREDVRQVWRQEAESWELLPAVDLGRPDWRGLSVYEASRLPPVAAGAIGPMRQAWQGGQPRGVCPVCGVRPLSRKGQAGQVESKTVCATCLKRRMGRVSHWRKHPEETIWMEEAADSNGRVCFLGLKLGLDGWLRAERSLVEETLFVQAPAVNEAEDGPRVAKFANFARQRRVWECAESFWERMLEEVRRSCGQRIRGVLRAEVPAATLKAGPSFVLVQGRRRLSVAWDKESHEFTTTENLDRAMAADGWEGGAEAWLAGWQGRVGLVETTGYGEDDHDRGEVAITSTGIDHQEYAPLIRVLARPEETVAIVPAACAWEAAMKVKTAYEEEAALVRDRLPLQVSLLFARAEIPVAAMLKAVRRMMARQQEEAVYEVRSIQADADMNRPLAIDLGDGLGWNAQRWCGHPNIPRERRADRWYGYVRRPKAAPRLAARLSQREQVVVSVSDFDYAYLDGAGGLYEIAYDKAGRRCGEGLDHLPLPLERMQEMEDCWQRISGQLHTGQANSLLAALGEKREFWREWDKDNRAWEGFAETVLGTRNWKDASGYEEKRAEWMEGARRRVLESALEIRLKILKEKTERSRKEGDVE